MKNEISRFMQTSIYEGLLGMKSEFEVADVTNQMRRSAAAWEGVQK